MDIKEIHKWNLTYGLNKVLLRNLVVGIIAIQFLIIIWQANRLSLCNENRVKEIREINSKLERKTDIYDSIHNEFLDKYYKLKSAADVKK